MSYTVFEPHKIAILKCESGGVPAGTQVELLGKDEASYLVLSPCLTETTPTLFADMPDYCQYEGYVFWVYPERLDFNCELNTEDGSEAYWQEMIQ